MNKNSKLNVAIVYNNDGANCIDIGDYKGAVSKLSLALQAAKSCMVDEEGESQQEEHPLGLDSLMAREAPKESSIDDEFYVYNQVIRIPEIIDYSGDTQQQNDDIAMDRNSMSSNNLSYKVVCSAVSIFNLALAHHLCAIQNPINGEAFLQKAGRLYEFGLQVHQGIRPEEANHSDCNFFYLAILNNLTDVHRRLCDSATAKKCSEGLLQMLMFLTDSRHKAAGTLDAFYQNTFIYLLSSRGVNAAAAA